MRNEHSLKRKVHTYLRKRKIERKDLWFLKTAGGPHQRAGALDYLVCLNGRLVAMELKDPKEKEAKPTANQALEIRDILAAGGIAVCLNSFEDFLTVLLSVESGTNEPNVQMLHETAE